MSLFTTPLTLNDGTDDRIFDYQYQEPGNTVAARYNEPASSSTSESRIRTAHSTTKAGRMRHLIQSSELVATSDADLLPQTIIANVTLEHHPLHTSASIEKRLKLVLAAAGISGITVKLVQGNI
jgi:hypothetical protein